MTPERTFWELIKDHLPGDVSRIENGADEGTPDVSGAYGRDYWVELKVCFNKRDLAQVPSLLLASQVVWHLRRARHGSTRPSAPATDQLYTWPSDIRI